MGDVADELVFGSHDFAFGIEPGIELDLGAVQLAPRREPIGNDGAERQQEHHQERH